MLAEIINSSLPEQLIVLLLAAIPVAELRGAIPVAVEILGLPWYYAFLLGILGNLLPVPVLLLFYGTFSRWVSRTPTGKRVTDWIYSRTTKRASLIQKHQHVGLILFVAVPLPGTGAWTGSIAAHLLGMRFKHALLDIAIGVVGAGVIVTALTLMGWVGAGIALAGLIVLAGLSMWGQRRSKKLTASRSQPNLASRRK